MVSINIPYPPSVNHYWGRQGHRSFLGVKATKFRADVIQIVKSMNLQPYVPNDRLKIIIDVYPPDLRRRDIDNTIKGLLDSLMHAKLIPDDSQIDKISVTRKEVVKGGMCIVLIDKIG